MAPAMVATDVTGGTEAVLIVEDNPLVRRYVSEQLSSLGYDATATANGVEALAFLDLGLPCDLLFTDIIMPGGMNGRELAEATLTHRQGIKVLFTSGYAESAIMHHGRLAPGVHLLPKPYRKSDLARMVRVAIGQN